MRSPLLLLLLILASPTTAQPCDGQGWTLRACLRATYKPTGLVLDYDAQRDALFADVWLQPSPDGPTPYHVEGLYGGAQVPLVLDDPAETPRARAQRLGLNTEHVYPQSRGAAGGNARADLHHLAPVHNTLNSARSNWPFADVGDDEAVLWCRASACTATRPTTSADGSWSRLYREGAEPPYTNGRFEPRDAVKGDVARAAFYFATMYQVEAEDALPWPDGRAWFQDQKGTLLRWHEADPPDDEETERTLRAAAYQGDRPNPFVLFPALVRDAFFRGPQQQGGRPDVWINEIHATNDGPDTGEGVELAGGSGTDLYAWRLVFYGGHDGEPYNPADPLVAERVTFDTRLPIEAGSGDDALGTVWLPVRGLWNRCHGLALFDPDFELVQFLSYNGCVFNATSGPVYDRALASGASGDPSGGPYAPTPDSLLWSSPVRGLGSHGRPQEWSTLPPGYSLQLTGAGSAYRDFTWGGPYPATPGRLNDYQAPTGGNRSSGWHPGDPVPAPELAPPPRSPSSRERLAQGLVPQPVGGPETDHTLSVGFPHPNPAGSLVRFDVTIPSKTNATAELYDVLGRRVAHTPIPHSPLTIDVADLAPGLYLLRITAADRAVTRPLTIVR